MRTDIEASWHGDAAVAFSTQLHRIERCIATQQEYTLLAAQAVAMMYAVNVQFRASCRDLMDKTADTCAAVMANSGTSPGLTWSSVGAGLVRAAIDAIKGADPGQIKRWLVDQVLSQWRGP